MEDLLLRNALPRLYFLVQDLNQAVLLLAGVFRKVGGLAYFWGGDTVLGSVGNVRSLLAAMNEVRDALPCTFSAGVGTSVSDALVALSLAKARGPGAVVRVRRFRGELRPAHWEEPDGWREEPPAPGSASGFLRHDAGGPRAPARREQNHRRAARGSRRPNGRLNLKGRRGFPLPSG
jgi:hypothetical protein